MRGDVQPRLLVLAGVAVLSIAGPMLFAQDSAGGEPPPAAEVKGRERITVEFKETSIREILEWISNRVGKPITLDEGIEDKVSVRFEDVPYVEAVEDVADRARCVTRRSGDTIVVSKPPRVTMEFKRAELVEVIHLIAKEANANVVIDPGIKGDVTMRFSDVPWMRALSAVVKTSGYTLIEEDRGRIIRVVDPSKLQTQMETRVFQFKHIRPDVYYKARVRLNIGVGVQPSSGDPIPVFTLLDTLRNMLTRSPNSRRGTSPTTLGRLDYYKDGNCIIVVDTKPVLDQMANIIRQLDAEPVQILLDVTSVTTSNEDVLQMCANWSSLNDRGITMGHGPSDSNGNAPSQASGRYPFIVGSAPTGTPSSAALDAFLNDHDMGAILRLLSRDADTEFIVRPNVAVQPDAGARLSFGVFVGEEIHYSELQRSPQPLGAPAIGAPAQETPPGPGVLQISMGECPGNASNAADLYLIPHLVVGTNKFILTVTPPDERLLGNPSQVEGFEKFKAPSGATTTEVGRCIRPATVMTHVLIESGRTVVFAWPRPERTGPTSRKLPYVGESSVLGQMFRRMAEKAARTRVFLFVRPHAVRDPSSPR